jgi:hypothetical protein
MDVMFKKERYLDSFIQCVHGMDMFEATSQDFLVRIKKYRR